MRITIGVWAAAIAALTCASSLRAHHSISMIDVSISHWVKGTVVRYEPVSPHAMIELEEATEDGQVQRWTIEGPFPGRLNRILSLNGMTGGADFLEPGDSIEVCGFFPKRNTGTPRNYDAAPRRYVHGQVLVMPDGRLQSWGPYGKIDNCVRPDDRPERWLDFLNADPLAREFWCMHLPNMKGVASSAPRGFVDEINRRLTPPCGQ
jgi:hypothetical protein